MISIAKGDILYSNMNSNTVNCNVTFILILNGIGASSLASFGSGVNCNSEL